MYQEERIYQILKLLKEKKTMTNQEIMDYFHISRDTARRDIVRLVNENLAVRTHGGITLNDVHQIGSYQIRKQENEEIKNKIGKVDVEEFEDAAIKRKLARRSQNVCLVADHSKFNKKSTYKALDFQDIDIFITDFLPEEYKDKINCQIIEVKEEK